MGLFQEFKEFAMRGSVVDLAVGVVIGAAFGKIVTSLVEDVLMPPIGVALGGVDFSSLALVLKPAAAGVEPVLLRYGAFTNTVIQFLIVAASIFLVVKAMNTLTRKAPAAAEAPPAPKEEVVLLTQIRDALRR